MKVKKQISKRDSVVNAILKVLEIDNDTIVPEHLEFIRSSADNLIEANKLYSLFGHLKHHCDVLKGKKEAK
jgi:hypothetical protein